MSPPDKDIIKLFRKNHHQGLKAVFDKYYVDLCRYAQKMTGSLDVAEDTVQDLLVRCWQAKSISSVTISLRSYLYAGVRNSCINHLKQPQAPRHISLDELATPELFVDDGAHDAAEADSNTSGEEISRMQEAVDRLPEKGRQVFGLIVLEGYTYKQAAARMEVSVNTVKTHLCRAMQKLRSELYDQAGILLFLMYLPFFS